MISSRKVRFVLVGVVNTAFSFGLYSLFLYLGMHFATANLCATLVGIAFSFRMHGSFVFDNKSWRPLLRFVPAWILIYVINVGLIAALTALGMNAYGAGAVSLVPTVIMSFFVQRRFVFARKSPVLRAHLSK